MTSTNVPCKTVYLYYWDKEEQEEVLAFEAHLDYLQISTNKDWYNQSDQDLINELTKGDDPKRYRVVRKEEFLPWPDHVPHPRS